MAVEQPKKPAGGAYGQFLAEKRPELAAQCKGQPITAVTKLASEKFKALSEADRAIYQEKFVAAKAKYDEDMKAFLDAGGEKKVIQKKGKKADKKKKKDPEAPKKPAGGAYGCFLAKHRPAFMKECSGQPVTAVTKLASAKWKELGAEEKKIYEEEYEKKKTEYQEAMKSYVPLSKEADGESDEPAAKKRKTKDGAAKSKEEKEAAKDLAKAAKAQAKEAKDAKKAEAKGKAAAKPKGKAAAKAKAAEETKTVKVEAAVAAKAEKLGYKATLLKLAAHPEVVAAGKSQGDMLKALEEKKGLLHPAKRALLGA